MIKLPVLMLSALLTSCAEKKIEIKGDVSCEAFTLIESLPEEKETISKLSISDSLEDHNDVYTDICPKEAALQRLNNAEIQ